MSKSALDWSKLLVDSQQIKASINLNSVNDSNIRTAQQGLKRGISELNEATRQLNATDIKSSSVDNALRLLAKKSFDGEALRKEIRSIHYPKGMDARQRFDHTDITSFLGHHQDTIILSTINESRKSSEKDIKFLQGKWAAEEWSKSKRSFLENLGHKPFNIDIDASNATRDKSRENIENFSTRQHLDKFPAFLRYHIEIFQKLAEQSCLPAQDLKAIGGFLYRPAVEVLHIMKNDDINRFKEKSISDLKSYKTLLEILMTITHENNAVPVSPGYFSPICFSSTTETSTAMKLRITYDMKCYFESQMLQIWDQKMLESGAALDSLNHAGRGNNDQLIKSYVSYLNRSKLIPSHLVSPYEPCIVTSSSTEGRPVTVWVFLYHSLRVGDFHSAYQELNTVNISGSYSVILSALHALYQLQRLVTKGSVDGDLSEDMIKSIAHCRQLYNQETISDHRDHYKELFLNLVSLADQDAIADSEIIVNLEDFLWANQWFDFYSQFKVLSLTSAHVDAYAHVLSYGGADYYDKDQSTPFIYAMVLFSCQRFGDAIEYLWRSKSLEAVHLMLICLHYGLILPHNALCHNPRHLSSSLGRALSSNRFDRKSSELSNEDDEDVSPLSILLTYVKNFIAIVPEVSLAYISFLKSSWRNQVINVISDTAIDSELYDAHDFKSNMIVFTGFKSLLLMMQTSQLSQIIGSENKKSGLYKFFDVKQVKRILSEAAQDTLHVLNNPMQAISMLESALMLSEALHEIINQLVKVITSSHTRESWRSIAVEFHDKYIRSKGKSKNPSPSPNESLTVALAADGKLYLIELLEILLKLSVFFINVEEKNWENALSVLLSLKLLPSNEIDVPSTLKKYLSYNRVLLLLVDEIFLCATDCLRMQYQILRESANEQIAVGIVTGIDAKIADLRRHSTCLSLLSDGLREHFKRHDTDIVVRRSAVDIS